MDRVNVAILGTGAIVREFHLLALLANERCEVAALGNLHAGSLEALARGHGLAKTYTDFGHLAYLERPFHQAREAVLGRRRKWTGH